MAKISAHDEIGQIHKLDCKLCYCRDGHILRNSGNGWKIYKKLIKGVNPIEHFEKAKQSYAQFLLDYPKTAQLRKLIHEYIPFRLQWTVCYSCKQGEVSAENVLKEVNNFNPGTITLAQAETLCQTYKAALEEKQAKQVQS